MYKAKLLKSFLIIASFIVSTLVIGESIIEEVITTGSYLNSQTDESNQTLTVIDRDFIDKINAQNVNDIVKNITSKGFVRSNYEEKLVDLSDVRINLKTKN